SGTYHNLSIGLSRSGTFKYPKPELGVTSVPAITEARLYPNPAAGEVWLSIASAQSAAAGITLTDLQGRTLMQWDMPLQPGENRQQFNIGSLPAGMYMVHIHTGGHTRTLKLGHGR